MINFKATVECARGGAFAIECATVDRLRFGVGLKTIFISELA
jgi:hypothetical protein